MFAAMSNLFHEQLKERDRELAEMKVLLKQTSAQVADLHRVKFTPIEKLVVKEDSSANLRTKILSRPPRQAIRR